MFIQVNSLKFFTRSILLILGSGNLQAGGITADIEQFKNTSALTLDRVEEQFDIRQINSTNKIAKLSKNKKVLKLTNDETITLKLSGKGILKPITMSAYRGIITRYSQAPDLVKLQKRTGLHMGQLRLKLGSIGRQRSESYHLYQKLRAIKQTFKTLDKKKLKQILFSNSSLSGSNEENAILLSWKHMASHIAIVALSDKSYIKYFCSSNKCNHEHERGSQRRIVGSGSPLSWGGLGNKNKFKTRRLIGQFIDNEFSEIVEWSKNHNFRKEEYIVQSVRLPYYNFNKRYFDLSQVKVLPSKLDDSKKIDKVIKISEDKANILVKQDKTKNFQYAFKVESSFSKQSYIMGSKNLDGYRANYEFKLLSDKIELFWDAELTDKWTDLPITTKKQNSGGAANSVLQGVDGKSKSRECALYFRKNVGATPRGKAAQCARKCQAPEQKLKRGQTPTQSEINLCNTFYDEFKVAAADNKVSLKSKVRDLGNVIGVLKRYRRRTYLETTNKKFDICRDFQGKFFVNFGHSRDKVMKLNKFKTGTKIKLIGVTWTPNRLGQSTGCKLVDIEPG